VVGVASWIRLTRLNKIANMEEYMVRVKSLMVASGYKVNLGFEYLKGRGIRLEVVVHEVGRDPLVPLFVGFASARRIAQAMPAARAELYELTHDAGFTPVLLLGEYRKLLPLAVERLGEQVIVDLPV